MEDEKHKVLLAINNNELRFGSLYNPMKKESLRRRLLKKQIAVKFQGLLPIPDLKDDKYED